MHGLWALCAPAATPGGMLIGLFLAGLAGSAVHCVPMCGGFVLGQAADRLARVPAAHLCEWRRMEAGLLLPYHLGRLTSYAALGALAAVSAAVLSRAPMLTGLSSALLVLAALLFLGQAARHIPLPARWRGPANPAWSRLIGRVANALPRSGLLRGYGLGVVLGFLPCGFLYGALVAAAATGRPALGAIMMAAFGLGTVPALMVVGIAGQAAGHRWRRAVAMVAPPLLVINAVLLLSLAWKEWPA